MTLRTKASMILCAIVTASLGISGYLYLDFMQNALQISILKGLDSVSESSSREISRFLDDGLVEAQAIASAIPFESIQKKEVATVENILRYYVSIFPVFENGMFILDSKGQLWADYPKHPDIRGHNFAFRQYFVQTMQEKNGIIGAPYRSARTGKPVLTFTAPFKDSSGRCVGLLGCSVQLTSPKALEGIRLTQIGRTGYIYVYNQDRRMILHPQQNRILAKDVPVGANKLFDAAIEGFEGAGETVNSRGVHMLISLKHIPNTNWIVAAQQPKNEAFSPIETARLRIIWGIIFLASISVLIGALLMRGVTQNLKELQITIKSLSNLGEEKSQSIDDKLLTKLDSIDEGGEIGDLKKAFKAMAVKLSLSMRSLQKSAKDWENTFDSVIDVIFLLDGNYQVVRLNKSAKTIVNNTDQQCIGQPIDNILDFPDKNYLSTKIVNQENVFNIKIKEDKVFEIHYNPLRNSNKMDIGSVLIGRDITSRLKANQEKLKLEKSLQKARKMEAIGTLAGGVAHDLNNVLSGIVSYPELILYNLPKDSPLVKPLETIMNSANKAAAIVQDLLTLARRGVEILTVVNLNDIVMDYLNSPEFAKLNMYHPKVSINKNLSPAISNIEGSSIHLSKVIMNLVSNAAEAMPEGGSIHIETEAVHVDNQIGNIENIAEGDYVVLTVSDEGMGIPSKDLDRIFEPFYTKKTMGRSGTGLGMSVVWGTIKDHNGYIDLESSVGSGTTFKLYFPASSKSIDGGKEPIDIENLYADNESILVVDDVKEQRDIATSILRQLGYSVKSVASGEEAVDYLRNNSVDLLVLDMIMDPGINGLETYRQARQLNPNQKAIITSGYSETDDVKKAIAIGAAGYLRKPYTIESIGIAVKDALKKHERL